MKRNNVCIYCASSDSIPPIYKDAAIRVGELCAEKGIRIINGAGKMGLMGALSNTCLEHGGKVTGVIPQFMVDYGWQHDGLTELIITKDMAERKQTMRDITDGAIALAGGCGTMEELWETITSAQLHLYTHPSIILNTNGFYEPLKLWWERCIQENFVKEESSKLLLFADTPEEAIRLFLETPDNNISEKIKRG